MQRPIEGPIPTPSEQWMLSSRAMRIHYLHLQGDPRRPSQRCPICGQGMEGALAKVVPTERDPDGVAESSGTDEEGPAPSTRSSRPDRQESQVLWPS